MIKACVFHTTCCALNDHQPDVVASDAASLWRLFGREFRRKRERERSRHKIFNDTSGARNCLCSLAPVFFLSLKSLPADIPRFI